MSEMQKYNQDRFVTKEKRLSEIKAAITAADGRLIPLPRKKSRLGEKLFMTVTFANQDQQNVTAPSLLSVKVFAERSSKLVQIGLRSYKISQGTADGTFNNHLHEAIYDEMPTQFGSEKRIVDNMMNITRNGLHVSEENIVATKHKLGMFQYIRFLLLHGWGKRKNPDFYRGLGLGKLMTATCILALKSKQVEHIQSSSRNAITTSIWEHFGWKKGQSVVDIDALDSDSAVDAVLKEFV